VKDWNAARLVDADAGPAPRKGHVESYFAKANDPSGSRALWVKATVFSPREGPAWAEAWAIAFDRERGHVAVKHRVPLADARFSRDGLDASWRRGEEHMSFRHGGCDGEVHTDGRSIRWSLVWDTSEPALVPFEPLALYSLPFPKSKLVSPVPHARFGGWFEVKGSDRTNVDGWPGMQGHNWGKGHADLYGWTHVSSWDDPAAEGVVLEAVAAELQLGPVRTPTLSLAVVRHRGREWRFSSLRHLVRNVATIETTRVRYRAEGPDGRLEAELSMDERDVVGLLYENPVGPPTFCLNSKIARATVSLDLRGEIPRVLTSRCAALEVGTKDPAHGCKVYV